MRQPLTVCRSGWTDGIHCLHCCLSAMVTADLITISSFLHLRERLVKRGTDSPEDIEKRVAKASEEMTYAPQFDKVLINDDLATALAEADAMVDTFLAE